MRTKHTNCHTALVAVSGDKNTDLNYGFRPRNKCGVTSIILLLAMLLPLASCGFKGKLKSPAKIEEIEAKKAAEANKKAEEEIKEKMKNETSEERK